jgi:hypothetical protein
VALVSVVLVAAGVLAEAEAAFRQGAADRDNAVMARRSFRAAADLYDRAWLAGERTPGVATNAARSSLLAGDLAGAVAACRRGLAVWPDDDELLRTLDLARRQVAVPDEADIPRPPAIGPGSMWGWWPAVALGLYTLGCLAVTRTLMTRRWSWRLASISMLGVAVGVTAVGWWHADAEQRRWGEPVGVVRGPDGVVLRVGDGEAYPRRRETTLPPGYEVRLLGRRGGWRQGELPDGTVGWLPEAALVLVE